MPTDLPQVSARKRKTQDQTQADFISMVSVWVIIFLGTAVLALLLADQSFSAPTLEWQYLF